MLVFFAVSSSSWAVRPFLFFVCSLLDRLDASFLTHTLHFLQLCPFIFVPPLSSFQSRVPFRFRRWFFLFRFSLVCCCSVNFLARCDDSVAIRFNKSLEMFNVDSLRFAIHFFRQKFHFLPSFSSDVFVRYFFFSCAVFATFRFIVCGTPTLLENTEKNRRRKKNRPTNKERNFSFILGRTNRILWSEINSLRTFCCQNFEWNFSQTQN